MIKKKFLKKYLLSLLFFSTGLFLVPETINAVTLAIKVAPNPKDAASFLNSKGIQAHAINTDPAHPLKKRLLQKHTNLDPATTSSDPRTTNAEQITPQTRYEGAPAMSLMGQFAKINHMEKKAPGSTRKDLFGQSSVNTQYQALISSFEKNQSFLPLFTKLHINALHQIYQYLMSIHAGLNITSFNDSETFITLEPLYGLNKKILIINYLVNVIEAQLNQALRSLFPGMPQNLASQMGMLPVTADTFNSLAVFLTDPEQTVMGGLGQNNIAAAQWQSVLVILTSQLYQPHFTASPLLSSAISDLSNYLNVNGIVPSGDQTYQTYLKRIYSQSPQSTTFPGSIPSLVSFEAAITAQIKKGISSSGIPIPPSFINQLPSEKKQALTNALNEINTHLMAHQKMTDLKTILPSLKAGTPITPGQAQALFNFVATLGFSDALPEMINTLQKEIEPKLTQNIPTFNDNEAQFFMQFFALASLNLEQNMITGCIGSLKTIRSLLFPEYGKLSESDKKIAEKYWDLSVIELQRIQPQALFYLPRSTADTSSPFQLMSAAEKQLLADGLDFYATNPQSTTAQQVACKNGAAALSSLIAKKDTTTTDPFASLTPVENKLCVAALTDLSKKTYKATYCLITDFGKNVTSVYPNKEALSVMRKSFRDPSLNYFKKLDGSELVKSLVLTQESANLFAYKTDFSNQMLMAFSGGKLAVIESSKGKKENTIIPPTPSTLTLLFSAYSPLIDYLFTSLSNKFSACFCSTSFQLFTSQPLPDALEDDLSLPPQFKPSESKSSKSKDSPPSITMTDFMPACVSGSFINRKLAALPKIKKTSVEIMLNLLNHPPFLPENIRKKNNLQQGNTSGLLQQIQSTFIKNAALEPIIASIKTNTELITTLQQLAALIRENNFEFSGKVMALLTKNNLSDTIQIYINTYTTNIDNLEAKVITNTYLSSASHPLTDPDQLNAAFVLSVLQQESVVKKTQNANFATLGSYLNFFTPYTALLSTPSTNTDPKISPLLGASQFFTDAQAAAQVLKTTFLSEINPPLFFYDEATLKIINLIPTLGAMVDGTTHAPYPKNALDLALATSPGNNVITDTDQKPLLIPSLTVKSGAFSPKFFFKNSKGVPHANTGAIPAWLTKQPITAPGSNASSVYTPTIDATTGKAVPLNGKEGFYMNILVNKPDRTNPKNSLLRLYEQKILGQPDWLNSKEGVINMLRVCLGDFATALTLNEPIFDPSLKYIFTKALTTLSSLPAGISLDISNKTLDTLHESGTAFITQPYQ